MTQELLTPYWNLGQPQAGPLGGAPDVSSSVFLSSSDNSTEVWVEPESSSCLPSSSDVHVGPFSPRTASAVVVSEHRGTPESEHHASLHRFISARPGQSHLPQAEGPLLWRLFPRCIRASNDEVCIAAEVSLKAAPSECNVTATKDGRLLPVRFEFVNDRQATGDDDDQPSRHARGPGNNSTINSAAVALRRRAANDALQALRSHRPDSEQLLIWLTPGTTPGLLFIELHVPSLGVVPLEAPSVRSGASTGALSSAWHTGYHPMSGATGFDAAVMPLAGLRVGRELTTTQSTQRGPDGNDLGGVQRGHFSPLAPSLNRMRVYNLSGPDPLQGRNGSGVGASGGTGSAGRPPGMRSSGAMSVVVVPDAEMEAEVCGLLDLQHQQTPLPMPQTDVDIRQAGVELPNPHPHPHATRIPDPIGAPPVAQSALASLEAQQRYGGAHSSIQRGAVDASASAAQAADVGQASWHLQGAPALPPATPTTAAFAPAPAPARSLLASGQSSAVGSRPVGVLAVAAGPQQHLGEGEEDQEDARARERFLWDLGAWLEMSAQAALARQVQAIRAAREAQVREYDQAQQLEQLAQQPRQQPLPERVLWQLGTVSEVEPSEETGLGHALGDSMPHVPIGGRVLGTGVTNPSGRSLGSRAAAHLRPSTATAAPPPPGSFLAMPPSVAMTPLPQSALELLGFACSRGWAATSSHIVLGLMDMGHSMREINAAVHTANGWSALHLAVASGSAELMAMTGLWRSYGCYSNNTAVQEEWRAMLAAPGPGGLTPLHLAAVLSQPATAALDLLSTLPTETLSTWFGVTAWDGCTPAHYASRAGNSHLNDHALLCLATGTAALDFGTAQGLQEVLPYMGDFGTTQGLQEVLPYMADVLSFSNSESAESERASAGGGLVSVEPGLPNSVSSSSWAPASTTASRDEANSAGNPFGVRSVLAAAGAAGSALGGHSLAAQQPLLLGSAGGLLQLAGHGGGRVAGRSTESTGVGVRALWSDGLSSFGVASTNTGAWQSTGSQRALAQRPNDPAVAALVAAAASAGTPSPRAGCQAAASGEGPGGGGVRCLGGGGSGRVLEVVEAWHDQQRLLTRACDQAGPWTRARGEQQGSGTPPGIPASFGAEAWTAQGLELRPAIGLSAVPPPPCSDALAQLRAAALGLTTSQLPWQQQQQTQASQPPEPQWMVSQQPRQRQQQQQRTLRAARLNPGPGTETVRSHEPWQSPRRVWPEPSAVVVGLLGRASPGPSTHELLAASQQSHQHQALQPLGASGLLSIDPNLLCQPMSLDEARQAAWRLVAAVGAARAVSSVPAESAVQVEAMNSVRPGAGGIGAMTGPLSAPADGAPRLLSEMANMSAAGLSRSPAADMRSYHNRQVVHTQLEMRLRPGCVPTHSVPEQQGQPPPQSQPQAQQDQAAAAAAAAAGRYSGGPKGAVEGSAVTSASKKPVQEAEVEAAEEEGQSGDVVRSQTGRPQRVQASEPLVVKLEETGRHTAAPRVEATGATPSTVVGPEAEAEVSAGCAHGVPESPGGMSAAMTQWPERQEGGHQPREYGVEGVWAAGAARALGCTAAAAARLAASPLRLQLLGAVVHAVILTVAVIAPFRTASSAAANHPALPQHLPVRGAQGGQAGGREAGASLALALLPLRVLHLCSALLLGLALRCWCRWRQQQQQQQQLKPDDCNRIGRGLDAVAAVDPPAQQQQQQLTALAVLGRLVAAAGLTERDDDDEDVLSSLIDIRPLPPPPVQDAVGKAAAGQAAQVTAADAGADG